MGTTEKEGALSYYAPDLSREKTILRVPESHSLHICPSACGRRQALRAIQNGEQAFLSFLYITEVDAISGAYLDNIGDAVETLMNVLSPAPRAFLLWFHCIDDFLGTDEGMLLSALRGRFPALGFAVCRMDPVAGDEPVSQAKRLHDRLYSLLEHTGRKDGGINLLGHYASLDHRCELFSLLSAWGARPVRELFACRTFDEYRRMAASRLNLVLMPMGTLAAQTMAERLELPWRFSPVTYDMEEVRREYRAIAGLLGKPAPDLDVELFQTRLAVGSALAIADKTPVVVDSSAAMRPFSLARALAGYGFNVAAVLYSRVKAEDAEGYDWLARRLPRVSLLQKEAVRDVTGYGLDKNCIALGHDCGYLLRAEHYAPLHGDEGLYGFYGIRKLMQMIIRAARSTTEW